MIEDIMYTVHALKGTGQIYLAEYLMTQLRSFAHDRCIRGLRIGLLRQINETIREAEQQKLLLNLFSRSPAVIEDFIKQISLASP